MVLKWTTIPIMLFGLLEISFWNHRKQLISSPIFSREFQFGWEDKKVELKLVWLEREDGGRT
jgi:hypothetical protein